MNSQPLPQMHQQVFTCPKCHASYTANLWNETKGKCKRCSRSKYNATRVLVGDIWFDSQKEATRYAQLIWLQKAGKIGPIMLQPPYPIIVAGEYICSYFADFLYTDLATGETIIEDCKGYRTEIYKLKKKLVEAIYSGVKITEV